MIGNHLVPACQKDNPKWHCQVDVEQTDSAADEAITQPPDLGTRHLTPDAEGTCEQRAMVDGRGWPSISFWTGVTGYECTTGS